MATRIRQACGVLATGVLLALAAAPAGAITSHDGWPRINGMLLMNKLDQGRPLDARAGQDPFHALDNRYRCDGLHLSQTCFRGEATCERASVATVRSPRVPDCARRIVRATRHHNELLGGHGNDEIHAG